MRLKILILSLVVLSKFAWAQDLEGLLEGHAESNAPKQNSQLVQAIKDLNQGQNASQQNVFYRHLEEGQWEKALIEFQPAFNNTPFASSPDGIAFQGFLKFKAGLTVLGLEQFFAIENPQKINFQVLNLWKEAAPDTHQVWQVANINWKPEWSQIFGSVIELKVKARALGVEIGIDELQAMAKNATRETKEWALIHWNLALAYALQDQADKAAKIMAALLKVKESPVSADLLNLTAGRLLFQNGYFDASIKYYEKVAKASNYWLEAQEEMAWAFIRKGEPQNAMAVTKTLTNPAFKGQVGAETHFVQALAQLRVCDYTNVVTGLQSFAKEFKTRAVALNQLSDKADTEAVLKLLAKMRQRNISWSDVGADSKTVPRMMSNDDKMIRLVKGQQFLEQQSQVADELYVKTLAQTGLQAQFDVYKNQMRDRAAGAKAATLNRVQELAKEEFSEIKTILNKMHIIEAEVIQQVAMADRLTGVKVASVSEKIGTTGAKSQDVLKFPGDQEVWFDELSNFKVSVKKGCQIRK